MIEWEDLVFELRMYPEEDRKPTTHIRGGRFPMYTSIAQPFSGDVRRYGTFITIDLSDSFACYKILSYTPDTDEYHCVLNNAEPDSAYPEGFNRDRDLPLV